MRKKDSAKSPRYLWLRYLLGLIVIGVVFLNSSVDGELLNYDDERYIQQNELIQDLDGGSLQPMFTTYFDGHYHPITLLSLAIDQALYKDPIKGHHVVNLILHFVNSCLVYLFLLALFRTQWLAFSVALLFMLHPMNVESYAWMTERKNLLYTTFYLAAALAYLRYLKTERWPLMIWVFALFTLSILSKAQAITFVGCLVLIDYLHGRSFKTLRPYLEKLPFVVISLVFVALTNAAQAERWGELNTSGYDLADKFFLACYAFSNYFFKGVAPFQLSAYYPYPGDYGQDLQWYVYASVLVVLLTGVAFWLAVKRSQQWLIFGIAFFVIHLILMLKFLDVPYGNYFMANRYNYLPLVGLLVLPVVGLKQITDHFKASLYVPVAVLALGFGFTSNARIKVWHSSDALWTDVLEHYPNYTHALNMRALGYIVKGEVNSAMADYQSIVRIDPNFAESYVNMAVLQYRLNKPQVALKYADMGLARFSEDSRLWQIKANVKLKLDDLNGALEAVNQALKEDPSEDNYLTRARIFIRQGEEDRARQDLNAISTNLKAQQLLQVLNAQSNKPVETTNSMNLVDRATQLAKAGNTDEALRLYNQAIKEDPNSLNAYINRGSTYGRSGNFQLALQDFQAALQLDQNNERTYYLLGVTYRDMGQKALACQHYSRAAQLGWKLAEETIQYCQTP